MSSPTFTPPVRSVPTPEDVTCAVLERRQIEHEKLVSVEALMDEHVASVNETSNTLQHIRAAGKISAYSVQGQVGKFGINVDGTEGYSHTPFRECTMPLFGISEPDEEGISLAAGAVTGYRDRMAYALEADLAVDWLFAGFVGADGVNSVKAYYLKPVVCIERFCHHMPNTRRVPEVEFGITYKDENRQFRVFGHPELGIPEHDWVDLSKQTMSTEIADTVADVRALLVDPLLTVLHSSLVYGRHDNRAFAKLSWVDGPVARDRAIQAAKIPPTVEGIIINLPPTATEVG